MRRNLHAGTVPYKQTFNAWALNSPNLFDDIDSDAGFFNVINKVTWHIQVDYLTKRSGSSVNA